VVNRLYRPRHAKSLPPLTVSQAPAPIIVGRSLAALRWRAAFAQVKSALMMSKSVMKKWGGAGGRLDWRLKVGRPVPPSSVLRESSYERFLGVVTCEPPAKPERCIARPRDRHSDLYHVSVSAGGFSSSVGGDFLPPLNTWTAWESSRPQRASINCCGTAWHEAAEHPAPLARMDYRAPGHVARPSYVLCAR